MTHPREASLASRAAGGKLRNPPWSQDLLPRSWVMSLKRRRRVDATLVSADLVALVENGQEITGCKTKVVNRGPFRVRGYSVVPQPGERGDAAVPWFWDGVVSGGRLAKLRGKREHGYPPLGHGMQPLQPEDWSNPLVVLRDQAEGGIPGAIPGETTPAR